MKAYRFNITVLFMSLFLSIFVFGFVATPAQASYKVEQKGIIGTIVSEGIVGGVVEDIPALRTDSNGSANKLIAKGKLRERIRKWKQGKGVVVTPTPTPTPSPAFPPPNSPLPPWWPCLDPNDPSGAGCWDY